MTQQQIEANFADNLVYCEQELKLLSQLKLPRTWKSPTVDEMDQMELLYSHLRLAREILQQTRKQNHAMDRHAACDCGGGMCR